MSWYLGYALDDPKDDEQGHSSVSCQWDEEGQDGGCQQADADHVLGSTYSSHVARGDGGYEGAIVEGAEDEALDLRTPVVCRGLGDKENLLLPCAHRAGCIS